MKRLNAHPAARRANGRRAGAALALVASLNLLLSSSASAASMREPISGEQFELTRTEGGTAFRCLGVGAHRLLTFKVYAVAYCVEAQYADDLLGEYARSRYPDQRGRDLIERLERDPRFFEMLATVPGDKMVVVRFLRDIPGERLAGSFRSSLAKLMPAAEADRVATAMGAADARSGQTALLYSQGDDLVLNLGTSTRVIRDAPIITERLWRIWLGADTPTANLRRSLATSAAQQR